MSQNPRSSFRDTVGSDITSAELREYMKKQKQIRADKKREESLEKKNDIEERRRKLDALRKVTREAAQKASKGKISKVQTSEVTKTQPMKALPVVASMKPNPLKVVAVAENEESPKYNDNTEQESELTKIKVFVKDNGSILPNDKSMEPANNSVLYNRPVVIRGEKKPMEVAIVSKSLSTVAQPLKSLIVSSIPEGASTLTSKSSVLMDDAVTSKQNSSIQENSEISSKLSAEEPPSPIVLRPISDQKASKHSIAVSTSHFSDTAVSKRKYSEKSVPEPKPFLRIPGTAAVTSESYFAAESSSVFQKSVALVSTFAQKASSKHPSSEDATGSAEPVLIPLPECSSMTDKTFNSVATQTELTYRETPITPTVYQMAKEQKPTTHAFGHNYPNTCDDWEPDDCFIPPRNDELNEYCEQLLLSLKKNSNQFDDMTKNNEWSMVSPDISSSCFSLNSVTKINAPQPSIKPIVAVSHESIDKALMDLNILMIEYIIQSEKIEMEQNRVTLCLQQRTLYNQLNFATAMRDLHVSVMKDRSGHEMRIQKYSGSVHRINTAIDDLKELCRSFGSASNKRINKLKRALQEIKQ